RDATVTGVQTCALPISADGHYRVSIEAYRSAGDIRWTQPAAQMSGLLSFHGDFDEALALGHEIAKAGLESGGVEVKVRGWFSLGTAHARAGDLAAAEEHLGRAIELARLVPNYLTVTNGLGLLGECLVRAGRVAEAIIVLEEADAILRARRIRSTAATEPPKALAP